MDDFCYGHYGELEHLQFDELGEKFDLGYKFDERESDIFRDDPRIGVRAWAEPLLILFVSVKHRDLPDIPTLRYGLARSRFEDAALTANECDRARLMEMARPHILGDVMALMAGTQPEAVLDIRML